MAAVTSLLFPNVTTSPDNNYTSTVIATQSTPLLMDTQAPSNKDHLIMTRLVIQKALVPLVVLIGVIGNSLSIVVLTRKCMKSSTNSYLTALAIFDLLYLVFSFTLSLKHHEGFKFSSAYVYWFPYGRVFTDMFANVSVILTVTFTVERYIGVCHPMKGRILCTPQRAKIITAIVSGVAILCTAPEFWEMEVIHETRGNETVPVARYTDFANQPSYEVGYYWFLVVMFTLLPLVLLCVFNGILISSLIRAAKLRREMTLLTPASTGCTKVTRQSQPKEQQKITKMLITVVLVFILCQLPGALLLLYSTYISLADIQVPKKVDYNMRIAANVTNLLIQINASINFILYSAISTKFRRVFYRTICGCRGSRGQMQSRRQSTFSRTDGVQMSSFYEVDKLGTKMSSLSSYTFKVRPSQRSHRSERSSPPLLDRDTEVMSRVQWRRNSGQNGGTDCKRKPFWRSSVHFQKKQTDDFQSNGRCYDQRTMCRNNSFNSNGTRNFKNNKYLWVDDN